MLPFGINSVWLKEHRLRKHNGDIGEGASRKGMLDMLKPIH